MAEWKGVNDMARSRTLMFLAAMILTAALCSWGSVFISVGFGPPALPVYSQPICPAPGYIWTPGYWGWDPNLGGYYWVPGTWVLAPQPGFLWTPGYWGFNAGLYYWHPGYWGPTVGFYGGINYGFGYPGTGYYGGYWHGRDFYYNRTVNNVNITNVRNVYNQPVRNVSASHVAYNGGPGGVQARATQEQLAAEHQRHIAETSAQVQHQQAAQRDPAQFVSRNQGRPAVAATPKPGELTARGATRAPLPAVNRPAQNANARPAPRPQENNQAHAPQNVPRPPANQQARTKENIPRPNTTARQPAPHVNEAPRPNSATNHHPVPQPLRRENNAPASRPSTTASNRPAPKPAPPVHNAPRPETAHHAAPAPRPEPQQQARQANQPPRPAPQQHAVTRPAPNMMPREPQARQSEAPRQSAAHQAPPPRGKEEERPR